MDEKKKDLRIIKTRKALYNAFEELMKSKPFEQIKVSDICNEALINRSTFYDHYADKYDLLEEYINSLKDSLTEEITKENDILYDILSRAIINQINDKKISKNIPNEIIIRFYIGGVTNICFEWLMYGNKYTKEDIINYINLLIPDNFVNE